MEMKGALPLRDILAGRTVRRIGIAVSGGGDSMALLRYMHTIAKPEGVGLAAVTVNHGLRDAAADEAEFVAKQSASLGIPHETLRWTDRDPTGNLQAEARTARYRLLADWAQDEGIAVVMIGHTADDQAETLMMNLMRGSGVDGLCGMPQEFSRYGMRFVRPLLGVSRAGLREYLEELGQAWVEDPSNEDIRYARVRIRQILTELEPLGLTRQRLLDMAGRMRDAEEVLQDRMATLAEKIELHCGDVLLPEAVFRAAPRDTRHRFLASALSSLSGQEYRPRFQPLSELAAAGDGVLYGCRVTTRGGMIRIAREAAALENVTAAPGEIWDRRFRLTGPAEPGDVVRVMGKAALGRLPETRDSNIPRTSLMASPAIWRGGELIAAPLAGIGEGWQAVSVQKRTDFIQSLLSR
ncbi:tRNA lysidine(34) synthetase TilS [Aliiruegeria lutimaris]|uniref:tRNA(Ile)-lysidine synthase n=1 Tax=Aliiruegeria lutimaris TaxID=571298 RepID=A0A1G8XCK4_9RHOB|nr:tRNA lysidine(34) synthetase TilS [Aliiruegeria lutimaris]SDJ88328.1 tRNA(Ile)-lysidine synthase [Aliiruegeria lutimaris]